MVAPLDFMPCFKVPALVLSILDGKYDNKYRVRSLANESSYRSFSCMATNFFTVS